MYRRGVVSQVDVDTHRAKVTFLDRDKVESPWLDVLVSDTLDDKAYGLPSVGAQVACLLEENATAGCIIGALYSKEDAPLDPKNVDVRHIVMKDGAIARYDRDAHELYVEVPDGGAVNLKVGGTCTIETTGDVHLKPDGLLKVAGGAEFFARADKVDARLDAIESNLATHTHGTGVGPSTPEVPTVAFGASTACSKAKTD